MFEKSLLQPCLALSERCDHAHRLKSGSLIPRRAGQCLNFRGKVVPVAE
jgi:hypothetical protein